MTPDPITEALSLLRTRRGELSTELRRVDEAIRALEATVGGSAARPAEPHAALNVRRPSVRRMLLQLLHEKDRDWSVAEVLAEYAKRGSPVSAKDPGNALRAAISDAKKDETIVRTARGRYKSAKWVDGTPTWFGTDDEAEGDPMS